MTGAADALAAGRELLTPGDHATVLASMWPQQPDRLLEGLIGAARERGSALTVLVADVSGRFAFLDEQAVADVVSGRLRIVVLAGAVPRRLAAHVAHVPASLWDIDRMLSDRRIDFDLFVARVHATAGDEVTLGSMIGYTPTALARAEIVGFEVALPHDSFPGTFPLPLGRATAVIEATLAAPPPQSPGPPPEAVEVARRVAELLPDGATLQLGLGVIPDALATALVHRRDLGLHSGIFPASVRGLLASGAVTGARKSREPGLHVATGVLDNGAGAGSWGPAVHLQPVALTHSPRLLLEHERLWAVNSAFEIDLNGCVNAEYVGGVRVASAGGQNDFFRAAHASAGGSAVLALTARTSTGRPKIVGRLPESHVPTSTGDELDYVVTDFGVARLSGFTANERAERLIAVAHPADRDELRNSRRAVGS